MTSPHRFATAHPKHSIASPGWNSLPHSGQRIPDGALPLAMGASFLPDSAVFDLLLLHLLSQSIMCDPSHGHREHDREGADAQRGAHAQLLPENGEGGDTWNVNRVDQGVDE